MKISKIIKVLIIGVIKIYLLIVLIVILLASILNQKAINEVNNICNQVEVGKKLNKKSLENLEFIFIEDEVRNQYYWKRGGTKIISCAIQVENEIVISKSLLI